MQRYINNFTDRNGNAIPQAVVSVYREDGTLAALYSDDGVTAQANPMRTDANGEFSFYAADGVYSITLAKNGHTARTISGVALLDGARVQAPVADYPALRAYAGGATSVFVLASGIAGTFVRDATVTVDNGGTEIVGVHGWKRVFDGAVSVLWFGAKGDGVSDDTAAIQASIDAHPGKEVTFPYTGNKYLFSGLTISAHGTTLRGLGSSARQTSNGVELSYTGSGDAIRIGSDDGNAYNSGTFNGTYSVTIRDLAIRTSTQDTTLALGTGTYKAGTYAIRNYRGSYMLLQNVWIEAFENGVWHIQQNNSQYQNVVCNYCKVGLYILHSYGLCAVNFNSLYCDTAVVIDTGSIVTTFLNPTFTHCGSAATPTIEIRKGSSGTKLISPYFEKQSGYNGVTAPGFVRVGVEDGYSGKSAGVHQFATTSPVYGLNIQHPYVMTTPAATPHHVPYLVEADQVSFAEIDCFSGHPTYNGNLDYFINATANSQSILARAPVPNRAKISNGTDTGVNFIGYGSGAIELGSNQGLVNFRNNKGTGGTQAWQWNMAAAGAIILDHPNYAGGQTRRLRLNRALQQQGASAPASGTYERGDNAWNQSPDSAGGVASWVCVSAGTPGTWQATSWVVAKATTAGRPTLTASDRGVMFMDTTLNANGKPIWWTGTAWVDATGAVV
jgi:hypothetical protein